MRSFLFPKYRHWSVCLSEYCPLSGGIVQAFFNSKHCDVFGARNSNNNLTHLFYQVYFQSKDMNLHNISSDGDQTPFEVPIFILCAIYDFFASYSSFKDCPLQLLCLLQEVFNVTDPVVKRAQPTLGKKGIPPLNIINTTTNKNIDAWALLQFKPTW